MILYIAALPFQMVSLLGMRQIIIEWSTIFVMSITAFTLLGILSLSDGIENPFGYDYDGTIDINTKI